MSNRLPPLNPLRVFEVAARSESFTEAAVELSVTQAAVSRQISVLENFFDVKLFDRDQRQLTLTADGKRLYREVAPAFEAIGWASEDLLRRRDSFSVTIQAYPTVTALKLIPNVKSLMKGAKPPQLNFRSAVRPDEFTPNEVDIVIRVTQALPAGFKGFKLAQDEITPAMRPDMIKKKSSDPEDVLSGLTLLASKYRHSDWGDWAKEAEVDIRENTVVSLDSSQLTYAAAREGIGVCMAQPYLIECDIKSGSLVLPFKCRIQRNLAYWCMWSEHRRIDRPFKETVEWIRGLAQEPAVVEAAE